MIASGAPPGKSHPDGQKAGAPKTIRSLKQWSHTIIPSRAAIEPIDARSVKPPDQLQHAVKGHPIPVLFVVGQSLISFTDLRPSRHAGHRQPVAAHLFPKRGAVGSFIVVIGYRHSLAGVAEPPDK